MAVNVHAMQLVHLLMLRKSLIIFIHKLFINHHRNNPYSLTPIGVKGFLKVGMSENRLLELVKLCFKSV